ncbi:DUF2023 family protein [Xanthobacter pseudotagetidis]|uniref:DUF2023 family protein n=1 Tax=Xanthobacter pseudotagetidis TaxID=3119911 RepID=UPI003729F8C3
MDPRAGDRAGDPVVTRIFNHNLYEYRRGVRCLFMMTMSADDSRQIVGRLCRECIAHYVHDVSGHKVNLFFGNPAFVETTRTVVNKPLTALSPEEDFMLGTLLGYDREQQCKRFLARRCGVPPEAVD